MPNSWFRLYAEIRRDPKVQTMPETFQLRLIWLFTLRCEGPTEKLSLDELTYGLGCNGDVTLETLHETFLSKGFIEKNWAVVNWDKRQYVSDSSTDRVKKYREKQALKQSETFLKRPETQNETDQNRTEQNRADQKHKKPTARDCELVYESYPLKVGKQDALKAISKAILKTGDMVWLLERVKEFAVSEKGTGDYCPHPATWFNKGNYYDDPATWNRKSNGNGGGNGQGNHSKTSGNFGALEEVIRRNQSRGIADGVELCEDGDDRREHPGLPQPAIIDLSLPRRAGGDQGTLPYQAQKRGNGLS